MTSKLKAGDPSRKAKLTKVYETLKKVRASKTVKLKPSAHLRQKVKSLDGNEIDFGLRYYQVQGAYHMLVLKRMILGDDTGLGKCIVGSTRIITDRGLLPISNLAPEGRLEPDTFYDPPFTVKVWTGQGAEGTWASVRRFYWNGEVPTLKVTTRNGFVLEGSRVHPVLVRDRETEEEHFVQLQELDSDQHTICIDRTPGLFPKAGAFLPKAPPKEAPNTRPFSWPTQVTPELARLLGYVVGESWSASRYKVPVSQHKDINPEVHEDIRALFQEVYGWRGNEGNKDRDRLIAVSSLHIREHLRACGVGDATSAGKEVPWSIWQSSEDCCTEFLKGLLDAEGSVHKDGGYEFSSASKDLARGVQQILLRLDIISRLRPEPVKGREHIYWVVALFGDDARKFLDRVGLVSSRKEKALRDVLARPSNPNKDGVPHPGGFCSDARESLGNISRFGNSFRSTLLHVATGRRNASYRFLESLDEALGGHSETQKLIENNYFYDPIATIEEGFEPVMDIEVDHASHSFVGNGLVNHNTVEAIAATCHLLERNPEAKVIIVTPKSTVHQWASEIERFTTGIRPIVVETLKSTKKNGPSPSEHRKALYREWVESKDKTVLILNYNLMVRDWDAEGFVPVKENGKPDPKKPVVPGILDQATLEARPKLITFLDEAQAFKNMRTKTWEKVRFLCDRSDRVYGLTATLLGSNLMEGYCIYKAIKPELFGTKTNFMDTYCHVELQTLPGKRQKIPIVLGYRNLDHFRERIDPFFLGRKKQDVSDELPVLISKNIDCELGDAEVRKYNEALSGVLELGDGDIRDFEENKALVALLYCQQVADSLALLKYEEGDAVGEDFDYESLDYKDVKVGGLGAKEHALVDLVSGDGELAGEKVIVYTRFAKFVPRLQKILAKNRVKSVCITGKAQLNKKALEEVGVKGVKADDARKKAQEVFQDKDSDVKVIIVTSAGGVGINLQQAKAFAFYNLPWTWGDYVQALGRMVRIGSPHKGVAVYHLFARLPNTEGDTKTIDHHVYSLLRKKQKLIDQILGEAAAGALDFDKGATGAMELLRAMQESAEKKK